MRIKEYGARGAALLVIAATLLLTCALPLAARAAVASDEAEARSVAQEVFQQLKSRQYDALYDRLPASSRARVSRERFTEALRRTQDMYELDRMEIGAARVSGNVAVVDTVMYGRLLRPIESEGKIVAQQYLVREDGQWRVATGDRATVRRFLDANPKFAKKFPVRAPRVYMKRDGRWVDVTAMLKTAARRRAS
ncbi:MAG: hypothetical protein WCF57_21250 [Pyrinomonadaceae bacterium]